MQLMKQFEGSSKIQSVQQLLLAMNICRVDTISFGQALRVCILRYITYANKFMRIVAAAMITFAEAVHLPCSTLYQATSTVAHICNPGITGVLILDYCA